MNDASEMTKDLKVRLPVDYHLKLQTLKILKGRTMSDTLRAALDLYFHERGVRLQPVLAAEADALAEPA